MAPEDIVSHVNTYQASPFLAALLPWLAGDPLPVVTAPLARFGLVSRLRDIGLTLYRLDLTSGDPLDALVIAQLRFYPTAALPYALNALARMQQRIDDLERQSRAMGGSGREWPPAFGLAAFVSKMPRPGSGCHIAQRITLPA